MSKHKENKTYEFIPDPEDQSAWQIRILEGMFPETIIQYGAIKVGEETDNGDSMMTFNFHIISSPDSELTEENEDLQTEAGDILLAIIEQSLENNDGSIAVKDDNDPESEWEFVE